MAGRQSFKTETSDPVGIIRDSSLTEDIAQLRRDDVYSNVDTPPDCDCNVSGIAAEQNHLQRSKSQTVPRKVVWNTDSNQVKTYNKYSRRYKKQGAQFTLSSSQSKSFKKKKVGFDAEQCGFLRINDIVLSISGNVTKTYEHIAGGSDRSSIFLKEVIFQKKQNNDTGLSSSQVKMTPFSFKEDYSSDSISQHVANYLHSAEKSDKNKLTLVKQSKELDTNVIDRLNDISLTNTSILSSVPSQQRKTTLLDEVFSKRNRERKRIGSLFEMIVPDSGARIIDSDSKLQRKSAFTLDDISDEDEKKASVDSFVSQNIMEKRNNNEYALKSNQSQRKLDKKRVSIKVSDSFVHIEKRNSRLAELEETFDVPMPVLSSDFPPLFTKDQSKELPHIKIQSADGDTDRPDGFLQADNNNISFSSKVYSKQGSGDILQESEVNAPEINTLQYGVSFNAQDNNSSSSIATEIMHGVTNNNYIIKESSRRMRRLQLFESSLSRSSTRSIDYSSTENFNKEILLLLCELKQTRHQIETLRCENERLKRDHNQLTNCRFACKQTWNSISVNIFHNWTYLAYAVTAVIFGIIVGKNLI